MATYLQGVKPYIPDYQPFQPDLNFYANVLQTKQNQYDTNWNKLNNVYSQFFNADVIRPGDIKKKDELLKQIDFELRRVSGLDLSLEQNLQQAQQVFKPFYEDKVLMHDMAYVKNFNSRYSQAQALNKSTDEKVRETYNPIGIRYMDYMKEDFINSTDDESLNMFAPQYTPRVNAIKHYTEMAKELGISSEITKPGQKYFVKMKNGSLIYQPLIKMFESEYANSPQLQEMYKVEAIVNRRDSMKKIGGDPVQAEMQYLTDQQKLIETYYDKANKNNAKTVKNIETNLKKVDEKINTGRANVFSWHDKEAYNATLGIATANSKFTQSIQEGISNKQNSTVVTKGAPPSTDLEVLRFKVDLGTAGMLANQDIADAAYRYSKVGEKVDYSLNPLYVAQVKSGYKKQEIAMANKAKYKLAMDKKAVEDGRKIFKEVPDPDNPGQNMVIAIDNPALSELNKLSTQSFTTDKITNVIAGNEKYRSDQERRSGKPGLINDINFIIEGIEQGLIDKATGYAAIFGKGMNPQVKQALVAQIGEQAFEDLSRKYSPSQGYSTGNTGIDQLIASTYGNTTTTEDIRMVLSQTGMGGKYAQAPGYGMEEVMMDRVKSDFQPYGRFMTNNEDPGVNEIAKSIVYSSVTDNMDLNELKSIINNSHLLTGSKSNTPLEQTFEPYELIQLHKNATNIATQFRGTDLAENYYKKNNALEYDSYLTFYENIDFVRNKNKAMLVKNMMSNVALNALVKTYQGGMELRKAISNGMLGPNNNLIDLATFKGEFTDILTKNSKLANGTRIDINGRSYTVSGNFERRQPFVKGKGKQGWNFTEEDLKNINDLTERAWNQGLYKNPNITLFGKNSGDSYQYEPNNKRGPYVMWKSVGQGSRRGRKPTFYKDPNQLKAAWKEMYKENASRDYARAVNGLVTGNPSSQLEVVFKALTKDYKEAAQNSRELISYTPIVNPQGNAYGFTNVMGYNVIGTAGIDQPGAKDFREFVNQGMNNIQWDDITTNTVMFGEVTPSSRTKQLGDTPSFVNRANANKASYILNDIKTKLGTKNAVDFSIGVVGGGVLEDPNKVMVSIKPSFEYLSKNFVKSSEKSEKGIITAEEARLASLGGINFVTDRKNLESLDLMKSAQIDGIEAILNTGQTVSHTNMYNAGTFVFEPNVLDPSTPVNIRGVIQGLNPKTGEWETHALPLPNTRYNYSEMYIQLKQQIASVAEQNNHIMRMLVKQGKTVSVAPDLSNY
tara:strand:- start:10726 stop:14430 length:3705 start_codon:yes stop_codon:yes gene_type:complete